MKERDIPIEVLKLENKNDKIIAFSWEPKGIGLQLFMVTTQGPT